MSASPAQPASPRPTLAQWAEGARVRTLPAAVAPVLAGTGAAIDAGAWSLVRALLAAGVALALQIGVNFANDYSDGVRGTDEVRIGPTRLTASGLVPPRTVKLLAFAWFGVAAVLGLVLVALAGAWWLLAVGALCVVAAWFYTGGKNPYGYLGLGDVAVFVFFGLVATLGTTYTQRGTITAPAWGAAVAIGLLACALLMANNVRDTPTDVTHGKRTLAVRLGDRRARLAFVAMLAGAALAAAAGVLVSSTPAAAVLVAIPAGLSVPVAVRVLRGATGRDLITVLRDTGFLELGYGLALLLALAL